MPCAEHRPARQARLLSLDPLVQPHRRWRFRLPRWLAGTGAQQPHRSAADSRQRLAATVAGDFHNRGRSRPATRQRHPLRLSRPATRPFERRQAEHRTERHSSGRTRRLAWAGVASVSAAHREHTTKGAGPARVVVRQAKLPTKLSALPADGTLSISSHCPNPWWITASANGTVTA